MIKSLHFIHHFEGGGAQRVARDIAALTGGDMIDAQSLRDLGVTLQQYRESMGYSVIIIHWGVHHEEANYLNGLTAPFIAYCHTTWKMLPDIPGMIKLAPSTYVAKQINALVMHPFTKISVKHPRTKIPQIVGFFSRFDEKLIYDWPIHYKQLGGAITVGGDGKFAGLWRTQAPEINWSGWVTDPTEFLKTIDIFAYPIRDEAFGIVLLEAMAMGLPIVTFDVGGISDIVKHGETGFLVSTWDEFSQRVKELLSDFSLYKHMSKAALVRSKYFNEDNMVHDLDDVLALLYPKTTVILPTFNRPKLLDRAIKSIKNQDYPSVSISIVRDGGSDVCYDKYVKTLPTNKGLAAVRNAAMKNANPQTQFFVFLDDDDQLVPRAVRKLVEPMIRDESIGVTYGRMVSEDARGYRQVMPQYRNFSMDELMKGPPLSPSCVAIRKSVFDEHGGWDESMQNMPEDVELWVRLGKAGVKFHFVNDILTRYATVGAESLTTHSYASGKHVEGLRYIEDKHGVKLQWA